MVGPLLPANSGLKLIHSASIDILTLARKQTANSRNIVIARKSAAVRS